VWGFSPFLPYLYLDASGEPKGQYADIVKNVFKHASIQYEVLQTPNRRTLKLINNGQITFGLGPKIILDEPANYYISSFPVTTIELRAYWQGQKPPIDKLVRLRGTRLILISAYSYAGIREYIMDKHNNISLAVDVEDHTRAMQALAIGRGDYMLGYKGPAEDAVAELKIDGINSSSLKTVNMHFLISKSVENGQAIMDRLDASYQDLYTNNKKRRSLNDITNFRIISKHLASSGLPNNEDLLVIKDQAYQHIINLIPGDFSDEKEQIELLNMSFEQIPVSWSEPTLQNFKEFVALMQVKKDDKTLLHCQKNYRASAFGYLYETLILRHDEHIAKETLHSVWTPNEIWQAFIDRVREHYNE
jgi:polar amino acid transport system substrate-binding protein